MNIISNNPLRCTVVSVALEQVLDPEIGLNVVDLGLIYQIDFDDHNKIVFVSMTLTTRFCPMGASLKDSVSELVSRICEGYKVEVNLVFEPAWNHNRISEEGKKFLNR